MPGSYTSAAKVKFGHAQASIAHCHVWRPMGRSAPHPNNYALGYSQPLDGGKGPRSLGQYNPDECIDIGRPSHERPTSCTHPSLR